jgi:hypothetical protein
VSKKREHRQAKKAERIRKKRDKARQSRGSRKVAGLNPGSASLEEAKSWPVGECYLSSNWHERGAHVHAGFTRIHEDGRRAAAFFKVDLADKGVVGCVARAGLSEANIQGELGRRSSDEQSMMVIEPELVVKLVEAAADWGTSRGGSLPPAYANGVKLFGTVKGADSPHEIRCGTEDDPAPAPPAAEGMFGAFKRRLGL